MRHYLILLCAVLLLAGCTSPQPRLKNPTAIPTLIPATMPAVEASTSQTASTGTHPGSAIFDANCFACHTLTDETKVGPGLAGLFDRAELPNGNPVNVENLQEWIRTGGGAMPGLPLSDSDLETVVEFLMQATATGEPAAQGSDEPGQQVFEVNCSVCHNLNDELKIGPGLAGLFDLTELPNGDPVSDETLGEWITTGGGAMPGVSLAAGDLETLITYLHNATK
jgi:mono/diheme cytochrome c family protein